MSRKRISWKAAAGILLVSAVLLSYIFCLPRDLFKGTCYSTIVTDREGELIGARIAQDGQWRFPPSDTVPDRYAKALIMFEDKAFRYHPGVNPFAIARAAYHNIRAGHVVSGGSTITMQVIRMSRHEDRNLWQKCIEAILATRLELRYSKDKILALYASYAPYGGNVVGLEAASWRYFGHPSAELSWVEAATLAILPNSPAIIHPGRNRDQLLKKRNRLLTRLCDKGYFDHEDLDLYCSEPLPDKPHPLPQYAPHLTDQLNLSHKGEIIHTDINLDMQMNLNALIERENIYLCRKGINDIAAIVVETSTGKVLAYCGNAGYGSGRHGSEVDAAAAPRSTGSVLKPILYYAMLHEGLILPKTLIPDIPINVNGFSPQNYDHKFHGAVPADMALARSLNVPSVNMLREYGVDRFHSLLKSAGMTTLTRPSDEYGLSLILGGAEGRLDEMTKIYASMARSLGTTNSALSSNNQSTSEHQSLKSTKEFFSDRMALWYTMEALKEVNRPDEMDWKDIPSIRRVAWKTGTSYGFRDAWAIGVTPGYAVGVWVGNADGEGMPGIVGAKTAGPVMFNIFNTLPDSGWFEEPVYGEYVEAEVCSISGRLKGPYCEECDTLYLPINSVNSSPCQYHRQDGFKLPPAMEWYYRQEHPEYAPHHNRNEEGMEFIYPQNGSKLTITRQLDGSSDGIAFNLAHSDKSATVYWHLDDCYLGQTQHFHQFFIKPTPGRHSITVTDNNGGSLTIVVNFVSY